MLGICNELAMDWLRINYDFSSVLWCNQLRINILRRDKPPSPSTGSARTTGSAFRARAWSSIGLFGFKRGFHNACQP